MKLSLSNTALFEQEAPSGLLVRNQTLAAVNDALYAAPAVHSAGTFHRRRNKSTYFYHFAHPTRNGLYPQVHYTSSLVGRGVAVEGIRRKRSMHFLLSSYLTPSPVFRLLAMQREEKLRVTMVAPKTNKPRAKAWAFSN
jgi:hypothetical protein